MNLNPTPAAITADKSRKIVTITWNDGHVSIYPFGLLRAACPCAECRGGHENMRSEPDPDVFQQVLPDSETTRLKSLEAAGSYGFLPTWEDGHHYGIYNWHYLRALCPCDECRANAAVD